MSNKNLKGFEYQAHRVSCAYANTQHQYDDHYSRIPVASPSVPMRSGVLLLRSCPLPHAMYFFRTFSTPSTINSERFTFR